MVELRYLCNSILRYHFYSFRSIQPEVFCKKRFLKLLSKIKGKYLRRSLFLKKVTDNVGQWLASCNSPLVLHQSVWRSVTLLKRNSKTGVFLWILGHFLKNLCYRTSTNSCFYVSNFLWSVVLLKDRKSFTFTAYFFGICESIQITYDLYDMCLKTLFAMLALFNYYSETRYMYA